ncbi:MAG: hypothetical protein JWN76_2256 [Chitinophagaceae bacterium]|nr:hypothetical protein [Chitinophagaceae bacterium]
MPVKIFAKLIVKLSIKDQKLTVVHYFCKSFQKRLLTKRLDKPVRMKCV